MNQKTSKIALRFIEIIMIKVRVKSKSYSWFDSCFLFFHFLSFFSKDFFPSQIPFFEIKKTNDLSEK
jgi:hypothetical protein